MSTVHQWETFQNGAEPREVPRQILDSWKRSKWNRIHADDLEIPWREVSERLPLVRTAEPVLLKAAGSLTASQTALALSDERGHIVWRWVSEPDFARILDRGNLQYGAVFDEDSVGTNGIGTALYTGQTAVVVGAQHYVRSHHRWACAATPVRHPRTGRIVGTVNISTRAEHANQFFRLAAHTLARQVEAALELELAADERVLHDEFRRRAVVSSAPLVAVNAKTLITDANSARLALDHRRLWRRVRTAAAGSCVEIGDGLVGLVRFTDDRKRAAGVVLELTSHPAAGKPPEVTANNDPGPDMEALARRVLTPLERAEFGVIMDALTRFDSRTDAARHLGISRSTLYGKLRYYRIG